jgi:ABC-type transporter Mla subunit MlaD
VSSGTHAGRALHSLRSSRRAAVVAAAAMIAVTFAAFVGLNPFQNPYEIRGVFASSNQLRAGSEVRIAGVKVGEVAGIEAGPDNTSIITLRIDDAARPVHEDAELSIEPRLVLEGNFYVAVRPGSPSAAELESGATVPKERTSVPVQLDQVLNTFDLAARGSFHRIVAELDRGLGDTPLTAAPGSDSRLTPPGYEGLKRAVREFGDLLPPATRASRALRGTEPGDLGRAVRSGRDFTTELASDPRALADGITNFNRLTQALADEDRFVTASVQSLDDLLRSAPAGLRALDRALPAVTDFAGALRPALLAAPRPLESATRFVGQAEGLFGPEELTGLLEDASPAVSALPGLERRLGRFAPLATLANRCLSDRVAWTLNQTLEDGPNSTGDPVYLDAAHGYTGAAGVVAGFDGNGAALRIGTSTNGTQIKSILPGLGPIVGLGPDAEGVRPAWLGYGIEPPYRPDQLCADQPRPDLTLRSGPPPDLPTDGSPIDVGGILP